MITSSPSPAILSPSSRNASSSQSLRSFATSKSPSPAAAFARPFSSTKSSPDRSATSPLRSRRSPAYLRTTVDAATQVSPPGAGRSPLAPAALGSTSSTGSAKRKDPSSSPSLSAPIEPDLGPQDPHQGTGIATATATALPTPDTGDGASQAGEDSSSPLSLSKRSRHSRPAKRKMPTRYEQCEVRDLVSLIAAMLMELIRFNDEIPLVDGRLTRFHSRAPPGISVLDYLQRLATHATLSPPLLLSMVYYIDRLCSLYERFTISSLTVHRFLIASATVASKGLSDLFWTNRTYARVGGITPKELKILELEFLTRMEWRIVPQPEVLAEYYRSLITRSEDYEMEATDQE